jgi:5-methylcytosine-specific restriction endonuclease McrA
MNYKQQLRTSAWLKLRSEVMERDNFVCVNCLCDNFERQLHVHHITYLKGRKAWEYPDYLLVTLCEKCHTQEHKSTLKSRINYWININFKM